MTASAESAFAAYLRAFETLDPEAALPFYHLPSLIVAPQGVFAMTDVATARTLLAGFMEHLRRQSYRRTQVAGLAVRPLAPQLASCSGTFARFNARDEEIARMGFTYTLREADGWKIVVALLHAAA